MSAPPPSVERPLDVPPPEWRTRGYRLLDVPALVSSATASVNPATAIRMIDGDLATTWDSGTALAPTATLTLGERYDLTGIALKVSPGVGTFDVLVSNDEGATWQTILAGQTTTSWNLETKAFPGPVTGKAVRLRFVNGGRKVMAFEVRLSARGVAASPGPSPQPSSGTSPTPGTVPTPTSASGPAIVVDPTRVRHPARAQLLGANRNHVAGAFPNGEAKLARMRELQPLWGDRRYLYRIGHGITDGRWDFKYTTGLHFEALWGRTGPYPYDDIRHGLQEATTMGAAQIHVVNFGTGTAEEAGRHVGYLNQATDTNRARYPFAQQNVSMFEIGNEISSTLERGHYPYAPTDTAYAQRAKVFAEAMRARSDVPIMIGAVACTNSNWTGNGWASGAAAVRNILTTMGPQVDFLVFHGYPSWPVYKPGDLRTIMAQNEWSRQKLVYEIKPAIRQYAGGREIHVANTEFSTLLYGDAMRARGMFGALYTADTLTLAMNENLLTAIQFCLDHQNLADASFFLNDSPDQPTAIFKMQRMLARHWGDQVVESAGSQIPVVNVPGAATTVALPRLTFTAATTGSRVYLMVTNRLDDADVTARVDVGFQPSAATAWELAGGWNTANGTEAVVSEPNLAAYTFKRSSVTIFEVSR